MICSHFLWLKNLMTQVICYSFILFLFAKNSKLLTNVLDCNKSNLMLLLFMIAVRLRNRSHIKVVNLL